MGWKTLDDIAARDGVTTPVFISTLHSLFCKIDGQNLKKTNRIY